MSRFVENEPSPGAPPFNPRRWARSWVLLRADHNMVRDVMDGSHGGKLELEYQESTGKYILVGNVPPAFVGTTLELKGSIMPELDSVGIEPLPSDVNAHEEHYVRTLDDYLIPYMAADAANTNGGDLLRLEGVIKIRCGWPRAGARAAQLNSEPHFVNTDVRIYFFEEGMRNGSDPTSSSSTLMVMWAPDAPIGPANSDGTVIGYG